MADPKRPSFLRGLAGRIGDRLVWGQNYNPQTGQFTATPAQIIGGIGSRALNLVVPGAGTAANIAGNAYYGAGPLGGLVDRLRGPGGVQGQGLDFQGGVTPNLAPQFGAPGTPNTGGFMPSPYGPYANGYQFPQGNLIPPPPMINPISGLPDTQTTYGVTLPNYGGTGSGGGGTGRDFSQSWAGQAGGGRSEGGGIGWGWTGVSGPAAQGLWAGMREGSDAATRALEMQWAKNQLQ